MIIKEDVVSLINLYDTFFLDVYGVLFDGTKMFDHTLMTLKHLKDQGKKVIIISNSTLVASDAKVGYAKRGMFEEMHYDYVVTGGELLRQALIHSKSKFSDAADIENISIKCMFMGNANIFEGTYINKAESYDDADFVYVGIPRVSFGSVRIDDLFDENNNPVAIEDVLSSNWANLKDEEGRQGTLEYLHLLEMCLKKNKILLVANPDIFAPGTLDSTSQRVQIFQQGGIGKYYEKMGGKVIYFGKPFSDIFDNAKQYTKPEEKIVMVGDTPWTDISGANNAGIDSALVMSGVFAEFEKSLDQSLNTEQKLDIILNKIGKKLASVSGSMVPTHLLKQFSHKFY